MSECPLCQAKYSNDTSGDELFVLHLTNLHGMDDDNAQDILGRSMESKFVPTEGVTCPECGSSKLFKGYPNSDTVHCEDCGNWFDQNNEADPFGKGNSFSSPNPAGYSDPSGEADYLDKHEKQKDGTVKTTRLDEWEGEALKNPIEEYIANAGEVDFQTMADAETWWDNQFVQYGSKPWADQNIAERRTTINAYLRRKQNGWGESKIEEHDVWDEDKNKLIDPSILEDKKDNEGFVDKIDNFANKMGVRLDRDPEQVEETFDPTSLPIASILKMTYDAIEPTLALKLAKMTQVEAYGFSKSEWDSFSEDTQKSLVDQLGQDKPETQITLSEYGAGDFGEEQPQTHGTGDPKPHENHDVRLGVFGVFCKTCDVLIHGNADEGESNALGNYQDPMIKQLQSEESMCDSCLDKAWEKLALEDDTSDGDMDWITMNGAHIPIKDGQDKKSAVDDFLSDKGKSSAPKTEPKKEEPKTEEPKKEEPKKEIDWDTYKHDYSKPASLDNPLSRDYGNNPYYDPAKWSILNDSPEKIASDITGLPRFIPNPDYDPDMARTDAGYTSDSISKGKDGLSRHDERSDTPEYDLKLGSYQPKLRSEAKAIIDRFPDGQFSYNTKGRSDIMELLDGFFAYKANGHKHRTWEEATDIVSDNNMGNMPFHDLPLYMQKELDSEYKQFVKDEISQPGGVFKSMADYKKQRAEDNEWSLNKWYDKPPADA